ncbi:MAG: hypothetical protein ACK56F_32225, partial [bacterium]
YNMCLPSVPANSDNSLVTPAAGVRATPAGADSAAANVTKYPNSAYYGYDLEKSSGILLSGINTRSTPPFLNINFAQSIGTLTVVAQAWGMSDVILVFDIPSRSVQAYI